MTVIAEEYGAIRFSEDEWLSQFFVPGAPQELMEESTETIAVWASEKYQLSRGQIWLVCQQLLSQGITIVLDGAAANKGQRDLIRKKASDSGVGFQLHYVTCDSETRRRRVFERNKI